MSIKFGLRRIVLLFYLVVFGYRRLFLYPNDIDIPKSRHSTYRWEGNLRSEPKGIELMHFRYCDPLIAVAKDGFIFISSAAAIWSFADIAYIAIQYPYPYINPPIPWGLI